MLELLVKEYKFKGGLMMLGRFVMFDNVNFGVFMMSWYGKSLMFKE